MSRKSFIWVGVFIGSIIGGYIPVLLGSSLLSYSSLSGSAVGAIIGFWAGHKISDLIGL